MNAAALRDEIALREASLADARAEHAVGELSAEALEAIERRELAALARAREALAGAPDEDAASSSTPTTKPRRRRRKGLLYVALGCFALCAVGLVVVNLGLRQAGTSVTGSVNVSGAQKINQLLLEAEGDLAAGDDVAALVAYRQVLVADTTNVEALTETGWLTFSAASVQKNATLVAVAVADLRKAVTLAPNNPATHLYYGIVAASTPGNLATARAQFRAFLALKPSVAQRAIAEPYLRTLHLA